MPQHIGIVACSAEGAALCYRTICVEGAALLGPHAHPEVSLHTPSLADYMQHIDSEVYPEAFAARGLDYVRPSAAERDECSRIIMEELVCSVFKPGSIAYFQQVIGHLKDQGCDAVVLGCTEIPLIISDANSPLPTLDSTRLLARAALGRAVQDAASGR